jgi:hypothetical protein
MASGSQNLPASSLEGVQLSKSNASEAQYPSFKSKPTPKSAKEFMQRAKEVAQLLAVDVADVS